MISKIESLQLIKETTKHHHSLVVSVIMRKLAERLGEDQHKWEIVGLLHDLDYDLVGDSAGKHGVVAADMLKGRLPEDSLHAINLL